jgi:hypothetical protein
MSKGSKWRKTDFRKYWDNWPLGPKAVINAKGVLKLIRENPKLFSAEEAATKILETAKKRPGFLIV